ncbi:MAG: methylenetetrahydrofolate reductase [Desulfarculus sp.]|nr:methylenetetrahydrofolate reductase [Pseudomonadota bacterium]MBV1717841.1 methylenetetrahydrofolate reductase [Desulfarculus sp.]MBU4575787.1 methylenetetrahydrofolate reductase [Pseudomonadota bacterium]MBU4596839.1 methylenetetrahydrofolate reductase [Pseudomonadota bacterium]MBV1738919.1 methylenetetrahydrofolate reductase [Desulfarculus sp.]
MKAGSNLEKMLSAGHFAVTGELGPPQGNNAEEVRHKASFLKGIVESVNITDNQTAVVRMASWAACKILIDEGLEPNYQMVCRDRNRLALMADILGATALGIKNVLCLSGDHQRFGSHPESKNVYDLDSVQLLAAFKKMRDEKKFLNDKDLDGSPEIFIGAASNPFADPFEFRVTRLAKKVAAGADFVQTQCIYNMDKFRLFMKQAVDRGLHEKCYILAGVTPMKSVGMAKYMAKFVPGMDVPESVVKRLQGVDKKQQAAEGIKMAIEQIEEFKQMEGVAGVHVMAIEWEHRAKEIIEGAGLLPRPVVD